MLDEPPPCNGFKLCPYELKIRDVFVVHGQKGQLIVQGSSRYKGISDIRVMAENILLYWRTVQY